MGFSSGLTQQSQIAYWGRWLSGTGRLRSGTPQACVVNRAFISPFYVPRKITFDQFSEGQPTSGNGNMLAGLYADNTDTPVGGSLLVSLSSTPTANVTLVTMNNQIAQGLYWIVCMWDNAVDTFFRYAAISDLPAIFNGCRYDAGSFALTNPCPAVTNDNNAGPSPFLRVKSVDT